MTVGADWAGEPKTRSSTSGGVLAIGPCFTVRHWSVTQATVSLSSAESEAKATPAKTDFTTVQNRTLDGQQQRQSHCAKAWTSVQSETLGGADDVGSTVEQDPHLAEQAEHAGVRGRFADKARSKSSTRHAGRKDWLHIS